MLESRWVRRLGPGIAAVAGILVIASTSLAASAAGDRPPPECAATVARPGSTGSAWWRLEPILEGGRRVGQRLEAGRGRGRAGVMALAAESFASGPRDGRIVVGSDDEASSRLWIIDTGRGCRQAVATERDVVRSAVLAADGSTLFEHRVDRHDRRDLGIWRRSALGSPTRVLPPPAGDPRFGRTWWTELRWSDRRLVVASCGEVACRFSEVDPLSGAVRSITDPSLGSLVGVAGDALVVRGACRGLPCPVLRADLSTGTVTTLANEAGAAVAAQDGSGRPVVVLAGLDGDGLRSIGFDGRPMTIDPTAVPLAVTGELAVDLPPGWIPVLGDPDPLARPLDSATPRRLDEVRP